MKNDDFRKLAKDILPIFDDIKDILVAHGVDETVELTVGKDGFLSFRIYGSACEMIQAEQGKPIRVRFEEVLSNG